LCINSGIPFYLRGEEYEEPKGNCIAISWRWLIKENKDLIVIHDSILPKYRGFAPLVNCLKNGEKEIGVTALFAAQEYDAGDIICIEKIDISYPIKISKAIDLISDCYIQAIKFICDSLIVDKHLPSKVQDHQHASYSLWLDAEDYKINWNDEAHVLKRFIDAVGYPYAGAYTSMEGIKVRIFDAEILDDLKIENRMPGKVLMMNNNFPIVVCGKGLLKITNMVFENKENALPLKKFRTKFV
jgi:methionyl-tRNA formyltransferase